MNIDLNCDLGESFGSYSLGCDEKIIPLLTSCNIACGFHASDPGTMKRTVQLAIEANIGIGAHPGLPDLRGFGRRTMNISPEDAAADLTYQLGALSAFLRPYNRKLQHVKPHGALYNMAAKDYTLSEALVKAIRDFDHELYIVALAGSETVRAAQNLGLPYAQEVFADRGYMPDGSLVPRNHPQALISDPQKIKDRILQMILEHKITTVTGSTISIEPDTICIHGDGEKAFFIASEIRNICCNNGIELRSFASF